MRLIKKGGLASRLASRLALVGLVPRTVFSLSVPYSTVRLSESYSFRGKSLKCGEGGFSGSDNSKTVYEIEKKLGWANKKLIFLLGQPSFFFIFYAILKILLPEVKQKHFIFNFIMTFSPGQNGKGKKSTQNGKLKKNGFSNRKGGEKNRKSPSFNKEKLTL